MLIVSQHVKLNSIAYVPYILAVCLASSQVFRVTATGKLGTRNERSTYSRSSTKTLSQIDEQYSKCNGIDIRELTISQAQRYFATNQLSSVALTKCYLERIYQMNPFLNVTIQVNPDALKIAAYADSERSYGQSNGSLFGIPILLLESIGTKDKMQTTSGSTALLGKLPIKDAVVVQALREARAVILGKANLSEFENCRGTNIPVGWSERGGQGINPYNITSTPEGSSSGPATSVATNLAMASIGVGTDGGLVEPASVQSLFTIKPTLGTPSVLGKIPKSHTQDCIGPMARTCLDLAIVLDVLIPQKTPLNCGSSFAECLVGQPQQIRVGIYRHPFWSPAAFSNCTILNNELATLENMVTAMKGSSNFEVFDPVASPLELLAQLSVAKQTIVYLHDFKNDINQYLATEVINGEPLPYNQIFTLADIIKYYELHPSPQGYNQVLFIESQATDGLNNQTYLNAKADNIRVSSQVLNNLLVNNGLDAVMVPSEPRCGKLSDPGFSDVPPDGFSLASISGFPSLNVPAGIGLDGVPFGANFIGLPHTEARLLQIACQMELLTRTRQPPLFLF